jgi:small-conductance mechanosensitive channel
MARDRWGRRRSFRRPPSRSIVSWRWEVGLPLFVMGAIIAAAVAGADESGLLFWTGVMLAGIGAAIFFSGWLRR